MKGPSCYIEKSMQSHSPVDNSVNHLHRMQEKADTKVMLYVLCNFNWCYDNTHPFSQHSTIHVRSLRWTLRKGISYVTGFDRKMRREQLNCNIVKTLGIKRLIALPGFHALNGTDNAGSFTGKGKFAH